MASAAAVFKGLAASGVERPSSSKPPPYGGLFNDPRTSSTQSLTPSLPEYEEVERRKLLVIYIHGFMGNDTSFQSFPAHVHKYLKLALFDSHVVHSKIYPRYKTYKSIEVARDNFSKWLEPLENHKTDVVLVGHSMGGLLAADVVLKPSSINQYQPQQGHFRHRILGTVNLDSPLLGMHPGIIVSGISSLFRKNETPKLPGEVSTQGPLSPSITGLPSPNLSTYSIPTVSSEPLPSPPPPPAPFMRPSLTTDANFNPALPNDVRIEERSWWKNVVHFVQKHNSEGLIDAAANHIMSHMEFGGSMFDFNSLKSRYDNIRKLEDVDDFKQTGSHHMLPQVRFIQYYTICNGYPKKPKSEELERGSSLSEPPQNDTANRLSSPPPPPPRFSDGPSEFEVFEDEFKSADLMSSQRPSLELISPEPMPDEIPAESTKYIMTDGANKSETNESIADTTHTGSHDNSESLASEFPVEDKSLTTEMAHALATLDLGLPPIPDLPPQPTLSLLEEYHDKDARKLAEKEVKRVQKVYAQAVKDREKAIKDREKIIEKRRKKLTQEAEKKAKEEKKKRKKDEAAAPEKSSATPIESETLASASSQQGIEQPLSPEWRPVSPDPVSKEVAKKRDKEKAKDKGKPEDNEEKQPKKQRKFCNVPKVHGQVDPKWIGVFMKDMDEVAAHTGLFFAGEHYESLVGEVGNTIVEWVQADMTKRAILGMQ